MSPTLESLESSISSAETWVRWAAVLAAICTAGAAGGGVRLWLLQRAARPLREAAKRASEERLAALKEETARLTNDSRSKEVQIEGLKTETAAWSARIAEAEARAAAANEMAERERLARVKLEARLGPRRLTPDQQRSLASGLKPFVGERFWVITETNDRDPGSEQVRFSEQLSATLVAAGWTKEAYPGWTMTDAPLPIFRHVTTRGVEIGYPDGNAGALRAAQALASGLTAANVDNAVVPFSDLRAGILINIGLR